jgi:hypothetical protein
MGRRIRNGWVEINIDPRCKELVGFLIALVFLLEGLYTLNDYGMTWDEPMHLDGGLAYLDFLIRGKPLARSEGMSSSFPSIISTLSHVVFYKKLGWLGFWPSFHLPILFFSAFAILVVYFFTLRAYGFGEAVIAATSLALFPNFIAHSHNNVKDAPLLAMFTLAVWTLWKAETTKSRWWTALAAVSLGLAFDTKINAILVTPILALWLIASSGGGILNALKKKNLKLTLRGDYLILYPTVAIVVAILFYPWLWSDFIARLLYSFTFFASVNKGPEWEIMYLGRIYSQGVSLPWHYAPLTLIVVTPPVILFFALLGLLKAAKETLYNGNKTSSLLIIWLLVPLGVYMIPGVVVYNHIRHFLEVLSPLCMLAGVGGMALFRYVNSIVKKIPWRQSKAITALAFAVLYLQLLNTLIALHPYEIAYFNFLVGGTANAERYYELDYYGASMKGGCEWLNKHAGPYANVYISTGEFMSRDYLRNDLLTGGGNEYYVGFYSMGEPVYDKGIKDYLFKQVKPAHVIEANGGAMFRIYKLTKSEWNKYWWTIRGWNQDYC